uniref:Uncharacterized protein n=1 Tax=Parascaris univalens TaxID=6257 RepID=A0A915C140_PARUN
MYSRMLFHQSVDLCLTNGAADRQKTIVCTQGSTGGKLRFRSLDEKAEYLDNVSNNLKFCSWDARLPRSGKESL